MKVHCLLTLMIFCCISSFAQQETYNMEGYSSFSPSPEGASLAMYAQVPVNQSTGVPNIIHPITMLPGMTMNMPISISYHSSSNRVDSYSSWIGMGWALNAGGVITRKVNGRPDEISEKNDPGFNDLDNGDYGDRLFGLPNGGFLEHADEIPVEFDESNEFHQDLARRTVHGLLDLEPDEFYFNFMGRTGMFVFNNNGIASTVPFQNLQIETIGDFEGFVFTDEAGYEYTFSQMEFTRSVNECGKSYFQAFNSENCSGWYLTKVENINGQVEFEIEYEANEGPSFTYNYYETMVEYSGLNHPEPESRRCEIMFTQYIQHIVRIYNDNGYILFKKGDEREDLAQDFFLESITTFNSNNVLLGTVKFEHSYFQGLNDSKRLRLDGYYAINENGEQQNPVLFEYNGVPLPSQATRAIDHWGFYNGAINNSLIPQGGSIFSGSNRETSSYLSKAGILERVISPTGAKTIFNFEPNEYGFIDDQEVDFDHDPVFLYTSLQTQQYIHSLASVLTLFEERNFEIHYELTSNEECPGTNFVKIIDQNGTIIFYESTSSSESGIVNILLAPGTYEISVSHGDCSNFDDPLGGGSLNYSFSSIELYAHFLFGSNPKSKYGGGQRIRSITVEDSAGQNQTTTTFHYKSFDDPERSSGILMLEPNYTAPWIPFGMGIEVAGSWFGNCHPSSNYTLQSMWATRNSYSFSAIPLSNSSGGYVTYKNVTEVTNCSDMLNCENGRVEYVFSYEPDEAGSAITQHKPYSPFWKRGNLIEKRLFNYQSQPIQTTTYEYSLLGLNGDPIRGMKAVDFNTTYYRSSNSNGIWCKVHYKMMAKVYSYVSEKYGLIRKTDKLFDQFDATKFATTVTDYEYDSNLHLVSSKLTNLESGESRKQKIKYVTDYYPFCGVCAQGQSVALNFMYNSQNRAWGQPIEIIDLKKIGTDYFVVGGQVNEFDLNENGKLVLKSSWSLELENPVLESSFSMSSIDNNGSFIKDLRYAKLGSFLAYDNTLNPVAYQAENDFPNTMIRDFADRRVVAKVENALPNQCAYSSFESSNGNGWNYDEDHTFEGFLNHLGFYFSIGFTGDRYFEFSDSNIESVEMPSGEYRLTFWTMNNNSLNVSASNSANIIQNHYNLNDGHPYWRYNEFIIKSQDSFVISITSGGGTKLDELRLSPINSIMTTTCYSSKGTISSTCDDNNRNRRYLYDAWGRLEWVLDDKWEILTHNEYHNKDASNPQDKGWFKSQTSLTPGIERDALINDMGDSDAIATTYHYSDDFGREVQKIAVRQSPMRNDVVSFKYFDTLGRQPKQYLPFVADPGNHGAYIENPAEMLFSFYATTPKVAHTNYPFSASEFEGSPISRVLRQGNVGENWQLNTSHVIQTKSLLNDNNEVLQWGIIPNGASAMNGASANYYPANTLFKQEIQDEHGVKSWEFTNAHGQVVCKRSQVLMSGTGSSAYSWNNGTGRIGDEAMAFLPGQSLSWRNSDVYFVYDDFGRLAFEIPAIAILSLGTNYNFSTIAGSTNFSVFDGYMKAYHYDKRGRTIKSKNPGEDWSKFVYNVLNQLVLSQTPELSEDDQSWEFRKYDLFGRLIQTGLISSNLDHEALQIICGSVNGELWESKNENLDQPYTNVVFPTTYDLLYTETYYDDYNFDINDFNYELNGVPSLAQCNRTKGFVTGQKSLILDDNLNQYLVSVSYYDLDGRLAVQFKSNLLGGHDKLSTEYDFSGKVTKTTRQFFKESNSEEIAIVNRFEYDYSGRLIRNFQKTGNDPEIILAKLVYNELGQVVKKHLHITEETNMGMQVIDYRYNERGWLTKINNADLVNDGDNNESWDVFGEELVYNEQERFYSTALEMKSQYNGNIAAVKWKTNHTPELGGDELAGHCYVFRYDALNQMTGAYYGKSSDTYIDNYSYSLNSWDESVTYDANGNVRNLNRKRAKDEHGAILANAVYSDRLNYSYILNSNKVQKITDSGQANWISNGRYSHFVDGSNGANDYNYDEKGRLRDDLNKGITFTYNHLDLVKAASNGSSTVNFIWDANGQKLAKVLGNNIVYYFDGIEFIDNNLTQIATADGLARCPSGDYVNGDWVYDYYLKDHLGNVRAVITEENSEIITEKVTVELERRALEDNSFDNVTLTEKDRPFLYPNDPIDPYSMKVSELSASTGKVIGPSKLLMIKKGEKLDVSAKYWFTEVPGNPLESVEEILEASVFNLGLAGEGILPIGPEAGMALINAPGSGQYLAISNFLDDAFENIDFSKPQSFLIYMYFDGETMKLDLNASGAIQVGASNELGELSKLNIIAKTDGYFFTYLTNRSEAKVYYDNMSIRRWAPMVRVVYDYYPFGLTWENPALNNDPASIHDYCYQDKEFQFAEFGNGRGLALYDFHARMYDPAMARWLVPDPAGQFFNPYLAMGNNPVIGVDPDGRFANQFFDALEYVFPIVVRPNFHFGSEQRGIGIDISLGIIKAFPVSARWEFGRTYFWRNYDNPKGWESRSGGDMTYFGLFSMSGTKYESGETSQKTTTFTIGSSFVNVKYENDYQPKFVYKLTPKFMNMHDNGDRYRSAAMKIQLGPVSYGFNLFTGDPGFNPDERPYENIQGHETYVSRNGSEPDKYRAGVAYLGSGPIRIGLSSERIRHVIQNRFAHDFLTKGDAKWFRKLPEEKNKFFFYFGTGSKSLW